jgi:hypothetical protein
MRPTNHPNKHSEVDSGMVEVSLALAGLIFAVATLSSTLVHSEFLFVLMTLVFLSTIAALCFLTKHCIDRYSISKPKWKISQKVFYGVEPLGYGLLALIIGCLPLIFGLIVFCNRGN